LLHLLPKDKVTTSTLLYSFDQFSEGQKWPWPWRYTPKHVLYNIIKFERVIPHGSSSRSLQSVYTLQSLHDSHAWPW
jgi:hypothetical protein